MAIQKNAYSTSRANMTGRDLLKRDKKLETRRSDMTLSRKSLKAFTWFTPWPRRVPLPGQNWRIMYSSVQMPIKIRNMQHGSWKRI